MNIDDIAAKAAAKIDAARDTKVNAVKTAAASGVELAEAAQLLAAAEQKYAKDYQAALRTDWTESDLRGFGLDAPAKKAGGRPRGAKTTRQPKQTDDAAREKEMIGATSPDN
ncbi:hypothetical protein [Arthrobacter sp. ISL-69]|uniref:hypothetical protein n=1 Tax=Arthrobacter sp. ISL-69 TaxID=2819113 RepID=UPI001BE7AC82|nr:hypothetical protein [Arthrobacter sp. ISL-69]MBT2538809.1 hypothetical protein [Arthrobacter sp. ISL-69]